MISSLMHTWISHDVTSDKISCVNTTVERRVDTKANILLQ